MDSSVVWSREELIQNMGCAYEPNPLSPLDPKKIPGSLVFLIDYAEFWGLADDIYREGMVERASVLALKNLSNIFACYGDAIMEWLSGPEADAERPTNEYVAYSALFRAGDLASIKLANMSKSDS